MQVAGLFGGWHVQRSVSEDIEQGFTGKQGELQGCVSVAGIGTIQRESLSGFGVEEGSIPGYSAELDGSALLLAGEIA